MPIDPDADSFPFDDWEVVSIMRDPEGNLTVDFDGCDEDVALALCSRAIWFLSITEDADCFDTDDE